MNSFRRILLLAGLLFLVPVMGEVSPGAGAAATDSKPPSTIPYKSDDGITGAKVARILVVALIGIVIAFGVIYVLKRFYIGKTLGGTSGRIRVIEAKRLAPRMTLILVEIDSTPYLLAESPNGVVLTRHNDFEEILEDAG